MASTAANIPTSRRNGSTARLVAGNVGLQIRSFPWNGKKIRPLALGWSASHSEQPHWRALIGAKHGSHHATHHSGRRSTAGRRRLVRPWTLVLRKVRTSRDCVGRGHRNRLRRRLDAGWPYVDRAEATQCLSVPSCDCAAEPRASEWLRLQAIVVERDPSRRVPARAGDMRGRDRYGRTIALGCADARDLGADMVRAGG